MSIKGMCKTNLDGYECPVKIFSEVPKIGSRVAVLLNGKSAVLKVFSVTHSQTVSENQVEPFVIIELSTN